MKGPKKNAAGRARLALRLPMPGLERERTQKKRRRQSDTPSAESSDAGTRTRVSWVKAKYADHLHHIGMRSLSDWNTLPDQQRWDPVRDQNLVEFRERWASIIFRSSSLLCRKFCRGLRERGRGSTAALTKLPSRRRPGLRRRLLLQTYSGKRGRARERKRTTPSPPPRPPRPGI